MRALLVGSSHVGTLVRSLQTLTSDSGFTSVDYFVASRSHSFLFGSDGVVIPQKNHAIRWSGPIRNVRDYDVVIYGAVGEKPHLVDRTHPMHPDQVRTYSHYELENLIRSSPVLAGHETSLDSLRQAGFAGPIALVPYIRPLHLGYPWEGDEWEKFCTVEIEVINGIARRFRAQLADYPEGQELFTDPTYALPLKEGEVSIHGNQGYARAMNLRVLEALDL